MTKKEQLKLQA